MTPRILFVTGTDTGAGKTILTALLLLQAQARSNGSVAALKPFCSGGREDAELLHTFQRGQLPLDRINPFHFPEPLSPWTAARRAGRSVALGDAIAAIRSICADLVLVEGAGGLLAPLGEGFNALDLIRALDAEVVVSAANKLGVLNHTLLTLEVLRSHDIGRVRVALVDAAPADPSACHNHEDLTRLTAIPITPVPFLPAVDAASLKRAASELEDRLAELLSPAA